MLKKREKQVFMNLIKNARMPDKHIAKILGITQPTVTRIRQKLEKSGYIKGYKPLVDFQKLGLSLIVLTLFNITDLSRIDQVKKKIIPNLKKMPEIFLIAEGEGMGKTCLIMSAHKDFQDFEEWVVDLKKKNGKYMEDVEHFLFSTNNIHKEFSIENAVIEFLKGEHER
ncbi:MAG: winged helix-turn-helix transcriptional regulator [Candidatus Aenigmatarchaeota archaeon]